MLPLLPLPSHPVPHPRIPSRTRSCASAPFPRQTPFPFPPLNPHRPCPAIQVCPRCFEQPQPCGLLSPCCPCREIGPSRWREAITSCCTCPFSSGRRRCSAKGLSCRTSPLRRSSRCVFYLSLCSLSTPHHSHPEKWFSPLRGGLVEMMPSINVGVGETFCWWHAWFLLLRSKHGQRVPSSPLSVTLDSFLSLFCLQFQRSPNKPAIIESWQFSSPQFRKIRMTYIDAGTNAQVAISSTLLH